MTVLFKNGTANGNSPNIHTSKGGAHVVTLTGTFDGASIDIEIRSLSDPNLEWVPNKTYIAAATDSIYFLPSGYEARAVISSAGGSTDVFVEVAI